MEQFIFMIRDSVYKELKLTEVDLTSPKIMSIVNDFVVERYNTIIDDLSYLCEEGKFVDLRDEIREIKEK